MSVNITHSSISSITSCITKIKPSQKTPEDIIKNIIDDIIDNIPENENVNENESVCGEESFKQNMECIDNCDCCDIDIIDNNCDYEIINESVCKPIKNRYRKQTWYEYFRKLYMVSVILIISIVVYFYYSYKKSDIIEKL